ncbi:MAG: hypothetical protein ACRDQU_09255 [Pseudonocardiaceae bacterium]
MTCHVDDAQQHADQSPAGCPPRRTPAGPRLDPADRPDPDELARLRTQLARRLRTNRFMRG